MRENYRIDSRRHEQRLLCPAGQTIAVVKKTRDSEFRIDSLIYQDYSDVVRGDELVWRKVLEEIADKHYRSTNTRWQRCRDELDTWVDYPIVKLLGILAAIVAAVASVLALVRDLA